MLHTVLRQPTIACHYNITSPPLMSKQVPVIYDDLLDIRRILHARFLLRLPAIGIFLHTSCLCASDRKLSISVSIKPGQIQLTVMFGLLPLQPAIC